MTQFDSLSFVFLLMAAVLPLSWLIGRKLAWKQGVLMILAWAAIFAVVTAFISVVM